MTRYPLPPCQECKRPWSDGHVSCGTCRRCFDDVKQFDAHRRRRRLCLEVTR